MRLRSLSRPGAGVDSKDSGQIFEAFFTTKPTGMGMGLAICRSIVAAHNGRLWASPGASGGTVSCRSVRGRRAQSR
jgi:signal transduction histidine kinase